MAHPAHGHAPCDRGPWMEGSWHRREPPVRAMPAPESSGPRRPGRRPLPAVAVAGENMRERASRTCLAQPRQSATALGGAGRPAEAARSRHPIRACMPGARFLPTGPAIDPHAHAQLGSLSATCNRHAHLNIGQKQCREVCAHQSARRICQSLHGDGPAQDTKQRAADPFLAFLYSWSISGLRL